MILTQDDKKLFKEYAKTLLPKFSYIKKNNLIEESYKYFAIELIIRSECNQTCNYCYLHNYRDSLYPERFINNSKEKILNNISLLLKYFLEEEYYPLCMDLFAGDMFYDGLFYDLMQILYNFFNEINLQNSFYASLIKFIKIPCNLSFCNNQEDINKVQYEIDKFKKDLNVNIIFSWSTDGYYLTETREKQDLKKLQKYFKNAFNFCVKNQYGLHPMVAACNVDKWIQNYDWLKEQHEKYFKDKWYMCTILEVRNNDWTQDKIDLYLKLLNHIFEIRFKDCDNDVKKFAINTFCYDQNIRQKYSFQKVSSMDPILFYNYSFIDTIFNHSVESSCNIHHQLYINCYDLSIVPCHRLAYPHLRGGYFKIENNKIIDIEAKEGMHAYLNIALKNTNFGIKCFSCPIRFYCKKQCFGACQENIGDYNIPCDTVCNLSLQSFLFLVKKYRQYGIFDYILNETNEDIFNIRTKEQIIDIISIMEKIKQDDNES